MKPKEQIEFWERVGRHVRPRRFIAWFLAINVPIALALSALTGWHNDLVGQPKPFHLLMRAAIASVAFCAGGLLFWHKTFRPGFQAEKERSEREEK